MSIKGEGFTHASRVLFGSVAATAVKVVSDASITATAPKGTVTGSAVDVTVTTPAGTSAKQAADQFTYVHAPVVTSVTPASGSPLGGYAVTIGGSGFTGATKVRFGKVAATRLSVASDSSITATVPAGTGAVDVTVSTPAGESATSGADRFRYGAPVVTSVGPDVGSPLGGYTVTIGGSGFTGASAVHFGGVAATDVVVASDTSLTATAPAGSGTVDVTVTARSKTSGTSVEDQFSYVGLPSVTALSPAEGPAAGGNLVQITGTSLSGATVVDFGLTPATDVTVLSDTSVTAVAPAGTGTVDVEVTVPGGTSPAVGGDEYTYVPVPAVTGVDPATGLSTGGTTVTISGTDLAAATAVDFGAGSSAGFTVNLDGSLTATAPASPAGAGPVDVTVTTPGGTSGPSAADVFTYVAPPTVTSVYPAAGPLGGGNEVIVAGSGFTPAATVDFGSTPATAVDEVSSSLLVATAPAGSDTVDVTVTTAVATSATSGGDAYTYEGAPTVSGITPSTGPLAGGVSVAITGTDFLTASEVDFGGEAAASFAVTSPTSITATAPSNVTAGTVDVTVVNETDTSAASDADQFTYVATPTLAGISPPAGPVSGGTVVDITGTGFDDASAVTFAGVPAEQFTVNSPTSISATAPGQTTPAPFGATVQVTTAGGTAGDATAGDTFDYTPVVPTITAVSPNQNTTAGDSLVTLTGTGFTTDATVEFGADGPPVFGGVTVISPTSLMVNSPAGAPGTVDLTVTTEGGTSAVSPSDRFTYVTETPTMTVTPGTGDNPGDTVTVTGSGFPTGNWNIQNSGIVLVQASPLATFLTGFSALNDLDVNNIVEPTVDDGGNFSTTFTLSSPFSVGDPNGACPPLKNEVDMGLVGCAIAALSLNATTLLASLGDAPVIFAGTRPDPPTLAVSSTTVRTGDTLHFTGSGWWGSYPGGGATAQICGLGGNPARCDATTGTGVVAPVTYSGVGGTLRGATVAGSIKVATNVAGCTSCFLKVTQPNLTPISGRITASIALTIDRGGASVRLLRLHGDAVRRSG